MLDVERGAQIIKKKIVETIYEIRRIVFFLFRLDAIKTRSLNAMDEYFSVDISIFSIIQYDCHLSTRKLLRQRPHDGRTPFVFLYGR